MLRCGDGAARGGPGEWRSRAPASRTAAATSSSRRWTAPSASARLRLSSSIPGTFGRARPSRTWRCSDPFTLSVPFVGRTADLARLEAWLRGPKPVCRALPHRSGRQRQDAPRDRAVRAGPCAERQRLGRGLPRPRRAATLFRQGEHQHLGLAAADADRPRLRRRHRPGVEALAGGTVAQFGAARAAAAPAAAGALRRRRIRLVGGTDANRLERRRRPRPVRSAGARAARSRSRPRTGPRCVRQSPTSRVPLPPFTPGLVPGSVDCRISPALTNEGERAAAGGARRTDGGTDGSQGPRSRRGPAVGRVEMAQALAGHERRRLILIARDRQLDAAPLAHMAAVLTLQGGAEADAALAMVEAEADGTALARRSARRSTPRCATPTRPTTASACRRFCPT